jgi:hypothetical protein
VFERDDEPLEMAQRRKLGGRVYLEMYGWKATPVRSRDLHRSDATSLPAVAE